MEQNLSTLPNPPSLVPSKVVHDSGSDSVEVVMAREAVAACEANPPTSLIDKVRYELANEQLESHELRKALRGASNRIDELERQLPAKRQKTSLDVDSYDPIRITIKDDGGMKTLFAIRKMHDHWAVASSCSSVVILFTSAKLAAYFIRQELAYHHIRYIYPYLSYGSINMKFGGITPEDRFQEMLAAFIESPPAFTADRDHLFPSVDWVQ